MLILDEDCVVRSVKAKLQVIKPVYAMLVNKDQIFEDKSSYRSSQWFSKNGEWVGRGYEEIYFVSVNGKATIHISKIKKFRSKLSYIWWAFWNTSPIDRVVPHRLINIAPYLESLKVPRNKWCELKEWLKGQNWHNPLDDGDMDTYVEKDKLMAKMRELEDIIIVPYDILKDT